MSEKEIGKKSGLKRATLMKYRGQFECELERQTIEHPNPKALYFHSLVCEGFCDYACNGKRGFDIAEDINNLEGGEA